jgi:hypothetical protein
MKTLRRDLLVACALVAAAADGPGVLAAEQPSQIFRGLFGPDPGAAITSHPVVELRVSTFEARGRTPGESLDETALQAGGFYSGLASGLSFRQKTRHALFTLSTGNTLRVYPETGVTTTEHSGYGSMELQATRRTTVRAGGGVFYTPFHQVLGIPGEADPGTAAGSDASVGTNASTTYSAVTSVARQVGRRGLLTLDYDGRVSRFTSGEGDTTSHRAAAAYSHEFARGIAFRFGDGVRVLQAGTAERIITQDIALGIDVNRTLTSTRRTSLSFTTGSSLMQTDTGVSFVPAGSATLTHRLSKSWQTAIRFDRGLQVADLVPKPFVANNSSLVMDGFLGRRASVRVRGGYSFGNFDLDGSSSSAYESYVAEARAAMALGRHFQVYMEHLYYKYRFPDGLTLPNDVPLRREQYSIRFGLEIWAPLAGRS